MNLNQLNKLPSMFVDGMPIGSVTAYVGNTTPPSGWLWLRKAKLKKTTYPNLYGIIGDVFNDGSQAADEFMLPDAEGWFIRNFDNSGLVDTGRVFGSKQTDALQNIVGAVSSVYRAGSLVATGAMQLTAYGSSPAKIGVQGADPGDNSTITIDASRVARTSTETRPKNIALNYIIKASEVYTPQQLMAAGAQFTPNSATEGVDGVVKLALQSDLNTGTDDFKAVTSKKLRAGFAIQLTANGYITFPTWMGGLIIQWGNPTALAGADTPVTFPLAFPNNLFFLCGHTPNNVSNVGYVFTSESETKAGFSFNTMSSGGRNGIPVFFLALGY